MKGIFWIIILLIPSVLPDGTKDKSELGLIAADFQILSRVTNAIALQESIMQKTVNANEVITEFLHITPADFAEIVRIDATNAISVLDGLKKVTSKFSSSHMSMDDLDSFKKSLADINGSLLILGDLSLNSIEENFKNNLMELKKNATLLGSKCDEGDLWVAVNNAHNILVQVKGYKGTPENNPHTLKQLNYFLEKLERICECYSSLPEYGQSIENPAFWKAVETYEQMVQSVLHIPGILQDLKNSMSKLKSDLEVTMSEWKYSELLKKLIGSQIHSSFQTHIGLSTHLIPLTQTSTGAFIKTTDTRKVLDDLDSVWFKEHIVGGGSTQEIKALLEPFRQMSEAVINLDSKWISFRERALSNEEQDALKIVSSSLESLENLLQTFDHSKSIFQYIDGRSDILVECVLKPEDDTKQTIKNFELQEKSRTAVKDILKTMNSHLNTDKPIYQDVKNITKYVDCLNLTKESVPETRQADDVYTIADGMKAEFFECSENRLTFDTFLKYLMEFGSAQLDLNKALKDFTDDDSGRITLENLLSKSNGGKSIKCFKEKNFKTKDFLKTVEFFMSLRNFPKSASIEFVTGYLRQIAEIKTVLSNTISVFYKLGSRSKRGTEVDSDSTNPDLILKNSRLHAQIISECTRALLDLETIRNSRKELVNVGSHFTDVMITVMEEEKVSKTVLKASSSIGKLLKQADRIDLLAKDLRTQPLTNMSKIFREVSKIDGFDQERQKLWNLKKKHEGDLKFKDVITEWDTLIHTNLNFVRYKRSLKRGFATVLALDEYFEQLFYSKQRIPNKNHSELLTVVNLMTIMIIGFIILSVWAALILHGFTESGRDMYIDWYLYHFGKNAIFENRWRYSRFTDYGITNVNLVIGKCSDDTRKSEELAEVLNKGTYINAYDTTGQTALHIATRLCYPQNVEMLIKHGIDRTLLDVSNKTAEDYIKPITEESTPREIEGFPEIQRIFNKYRNKQFRKNVPRRFKTSQFGIWITENTDEKTRDLFHENFSKISKYVNEGFVSHVVVKVDADGVYETNDPKMLSMIFKGCIFVKESWMGACNKNRKVIEHDYKHLVEKIKYEGTVYDTVIQWAQAMAKSEMPYLFGANFLIYNSFGQLEPDMEPLQTVITTLGGDVLKSRPLRSEYTIGSHPYLHANLPPIFVIRPVSTPELQDTYFDFGNPKTLFKSFDEREFWKFLLERKINRDTSSNPLRVKARHLKLRLVTNK